MSGHDGAALEQPVLSGRPNRSDKAFLGFLVCVLIAVAVMGTFTFREGLKTEEAKAQGEALVKWLSQAKDQRAQPGFEPAACAAVSPESSKPGVWSACAQALLADGGPLAHVRNAFSAQALAFIARCDPSSPDSPGQLVLEKISATPPGSAVSTVVAPMGAEEPLDKTLTLKVMVCDKGGYAIKVAEAEF